MLQLTPKQYETLYNLVEGNDQPADQRSLRALNRRGLINSRNHPTTLGWHTVGRYRYIPEVPILRQFEIDSWKGYIVHVQEELRVEYDDDGNLMWHRANFTDYWLDFHKIIEWYAGVQRKMADYVEQTWDQTRDRDAAAWGVNQHTLLSLMCDARDDALSRDSSRYYTNSIFYNLAATHVGHRDRRLCVSVVSFKYSLQDNEDEFRDWRADPVPSAHLRWTVEVD